MFWGSDGAELVGGQRISDLTWGCPHKSDRILNMAWMSRNKILDSTETNWCLAQSSTERLPLASDGSKCKNQQPDIMRKDCLTWRSSLVLPSPGLGNPQEEGRKDFQRQKEGRTPEDHSSPSWTIRAHSGSYRLNWQAPACMGLYQIPCIYMLWLVG